ncbi:MAG: hypothetical protein C4521_03940 [Actinobacteria bacterium]|nr:MAG: hypothetical protein C4521_03940 [Actinomycetota bacterium]
MRKILVVLAVAVLAVGGYAFVSAKDKGAMVQIKDAKQIEQTALAFVRNPYQDDYQLVRIAGYVQNLGRAKIASAYLEIQLLDGDGNKKELVKYQVNEVPAYSRKSFDANAGSIAGSRKAEVKITRLEVVK